MIFLTVALLVPKKNDVETRPVEIFLALFTKEPCCCQGILFTNLPQK